jgi:glycosyltransferase involved in cell wall biosynthesis
MLKIAKKHAHIPRFAVSKQAGTAAKKNGLRCDVVITNGVDPEFFVTRQSKNGTSSRLVRLKILFYCSSRPEKGISSVKLALPIIRQTLGFGKHLYASIGSVEAGDLTNFDINYGFLNGKEYQDAISSCDIFVYPSFFDGFPAPPLEAMASSVALVTTLVTGVDEWAINGENCLTVSPQNHAELAKAVCLLARDDALRWRISAKGRVVAERYKWRTSAKSLINFLDSIVDQS